MKTMNYEMIGADHDVESQEPLIIDPVRQETNQDL